VYICLFIDIVFSILGEAKILIWPWVQHWLWFAFVIFFRVHRQLVVGLAYVGREINPFGPRNALRDRLLVALFSNLRDATDLMWPHQIVMGNSKFLWCIVGILVRMWTNFAAIFLMFALSA
jgi:hypothetical protein